MRLRPSAKLASHFSGAASGADGLIFLQLIEISSFKLFFLAYLIFLLSEMDVMRVIVVGGRGTIGSAVAQELSKRHEILIAGRSDCDFICDMTSEESIRQMYAQAGKFDAMVAAVGNVHFEELAKMTSEKYYIGIHDKLMGQVNLVLIGLQSIQPGGSFTLTSGILSNDPIRTGSSASMVNAAIEGFVMAAAIEMPHGIRINAIAPTVITESMGLYAPYFRGFVPVPVSKAALAYSKSVEGLQTGQVYQVLG